MTTASRCLECAAASLLVLAPIAGGADEIHLRGGGRIDGVIVDRTERAVTIETGPGRVTLPMSRVERIVGTRSALEVWRERALSLDAGDQQGWTSLARWAEDAGLVTQARESWQRVLAVDPGNAGANAALGRVQIEGAWMSEEEANRARGYVLFEGRWTSPSEREALVREQADAEAARQADREGTLRLREAEARAREAEARAREAEAGPVQQDGGIPYGWVLGGGYPYTRPSDGGWTIRHHRHDLSLPHPAAGLAQRVPPASPPPIQPQSINGVSQRTSPTPSRASSPVPVPSPPAATPIPPRY